jgi:ApaG protein
MTEGIRVTVRPSWDPAESDALAGRYLFTYRVRIENTGQLGARLLSRRWEIHDAAAGRSVVEGPGVVGEQPHLAPGQVHEYRSFCVLRGTSGWMEGAYRFERDDGTPFEAAIPRFPLTVDA